MSGPLINYRDYIDFTPPGSVTADSLAATYEGFFPDLMPSREDLEENAARLNRNSADFKLYSDEHMAALDQVFTEIASTPEGAEMIQRAYEQAGGQKLLVFDRDGKARFQVAIDPRTGDASSQIHIPEMDSDTYLSLETSEMHDFSLQRSVVHELYHASTPHDEHSGSLEDESQTVGKTNAYMKKYYAETGRDESYVTTKLGGTSEYDINPNFNPDGYTNLVNISPSELRENLQNMSPERAEELGLEIQALREVSSNEKMFNGLFQDFRESSPLELDNQLGKMDQMDIAAQPSVLKDEITPPSTEPSLSYAAPSV